MDKLEYLNKLVSDANGKVHVNGRTCPTAIVTVDFGNNPENIPSNDVLQNILNAMESVSDEIQKSGKARVYSDKDNGIFWANNF